MPQISDPGFNDLNSGLLTLLSRAYTPFIKRSVARGAHEISVLLISMFGGIGSVSLENSRGKEGIN